MISKSEHGNVVPPEISHFCKISWMKINSLENFSQENSDYLRYLFSRVLIFERTYFRENLFSRSRFSKISRELIFANFANLGFSNILR